MRRIVSMLLFSIVAIFIIDCGGRPFRIVRIGNQVWMAENLNVEHYRNGDPIPEVQSQEEWASLTIGAWCYYDNDPANGEIYGKLYNWYAVNDHRGLAPRGWHVPTDEEWQILEDYLGGSDAGGKLKETGTYYWENPNTGATNESGFSALPGGFRDSSNGTFRTMGRNAYFWSSSDHGIEHAWSRNPYFTTSKLIRFRQYQKEGFSVRCIDN